MRLCVCVCACVVYIWLTRLMAGTPLVLRATATSHGHESQALIETATINEMMAMNPKIAKQIDDEIMEGKWYH